MESPSELPIADRADEIIQAIVDGSLIGGIAAASIGSSASGLVRGPLPGRRRVAVVDPAAPSIVLPRGSRQTDAAKRVAKWLVGDQVEGDDGAVIETPWRQRLLKTSLRTSDEFDSGLNLAVTRPTLRIVRGGDYARVLDEGVRSALRGERSPAEALATVADRWREITEQVGPAVQLRYWR